MANRWIPYLTCVIALFILCQDGRTQTIAESDWSVRLVDGVNTFDGRVEIFISGEWGTICDSLWGLEEADVVCRQLNYTGADLALIAGDYGPGEGPVQLGELRCQGTEANLSYCESLGSPQCEHARDVGVVCTSLGSLRLVNGNVPGEGRVEILSETGEWGTICQDGWDSSDATVACRQLGYPDALEAITNEDYKNTDPEFGVGSGPILLDGLSCTGEERFLRECEVTKEWGIHDCNHREDAGVKCDTKMVRLQDGEYSDEGRVEVYYGRTWGRVCSHGWSLEDAHVVCRELGYPLGARTVKTFEGGTGPVLLDDVTCEGNETRLSDCRSLGWARVRNCDSDPTSTAGVVCNDPAAVIKLLSGSSSIEGVVEHREDTTSGLICDESWGDEEARVICRQLGYQEGVASTPVSLGPLSGTIFYREYQCNGTEEQIGDCAFNTRSQSNCDPAHIAQVVCGPPQDFDLRLVGSDYAEQGRLEVFYGGEWGSILKLYYSSYIRDVSCRQMGYAKDNTYYSNQDYFGSGTGRIIIDSLTCYGNENRISECPTIGLADNATQRSALYVDAGVVCEPYEHVANHPVRLISEKGEVNNDYGRVEIYHDGEWGSMCDYYFSGSDVICAELGHGSDSGTHLDLQNYNFPPATGRVWFEFKYCYDNEKSLYECSHGPWGSPCDESPVAGVSCIGYFSPPYNGNDNTGNPDYYSPSTLGGWEIFFIVVGVIVPVAIILCCIWHNKKKPRNASGVISTYSPETDTAQVNVTSTSPPSPPPAYVPPSPPPTESPPTYASVSVT